LPPHNLWTKENRDATAEEIVDSVFEPSRWVDAGDPRVELASLDMERLRTEAQRLLKETPLTISKLVPALRYRIATREPLGEPDHADIKIVTLWGAKGLTSDYVYLMGLVQEALPGKYDEESTGLTRSEWLDEQRRLLYVSLTRAKKALVMSRPLKSRKGDIQSLNLEMPPGRSNWRELHLTEFLSDLPKGLLPGALDGTAWKGLS
jgi:superfamily I DNA/RNA helicase